jgi:hypothetical protein
MNDGKKIEAVKTRVQTPNAKRRNVERVLERVLADVRESGGPGMTTAVFAVVLTEGKEARCAYALTWDEAGLMARAVPVGLERALATVRIGSVTRPGKAGEGA